ncbi:MAG: hypothetical protein Ct9H300mP1_00880 [Planctomycetaceae bacterium]|nr:MAG: hypothetical protein Ct9H300mP1_00880 [Planctomycetaceae bacterium]
MTGSFSLRTALLAAGLGLLAMATPAVQAAGPQRVTRDGQLKFSPVFIDGGRKLVFSAHNQPKRVSIIQLDLATGKQSLHYPIGSDSQFDIAFSRDRKVECFARSGGPRQLSLVIRNRVTNKDVVFDPPGAQRSTVRTPRFTPDGKRIVMTMNAPGGQQIVSLNLQGKGRPQPDRLQRHQRLAGHLARRQDNRLQLKPQRGTGPLADGCQRRQPAAADPIGSPRHLPVLVTRRSADRLHQRPGRKPGGLHRRP